MELISKKLKLSQLNIEHEEIAGLMGYQDEIPEQINDIISHEFSELRLADDIMGGYKIMSANTKSDDYIITVNNQDFKVGKSVWHFLKNSDKVAMYICTAGKTISDRSKELMSRGDLLEGYVADTIGSVVVEKAMDLIHEQIKTDAINQGQKCTNRYSPGYCDWNVSDQKMLFQNFPENFCDISLSDSCLMIPIKSVSGIIGIGNDVKYQRYTCDSCFLQNCIYRKYRKNIN